MSYVARVPAVDPQTVTGAGASFFEFCGQLRGRVSNSASTWGGHVPNISKFHLMSGLALQREGAGGVLSCKLKEMTVLKTSHVNTCAH